MIVSGNLDLSQLANDIFTATNTDPGWTEDLSQFNDNKAQVVRNVTSVSCVLTRKYVAQGLATFSLPWGGPA